MAMSQGLSKAASEGATIFLTQVAVGSTIPDISTVFQTKADGRFREIKGNLRVKNFVE